MFRSGGPGINQAAVAITGGTIDGTTIGGTTPAAATVTTLKTADNSAGSPAIHGTATPTSGFYFSGISPAVSVSGTIVDYWDANGLILQSGSLRYGNNISAQAGATYTMAANDYAIISNASGTQTVTLATASAWPGRTLFMKTIANQSVISASSNVVPVAGGAAGTAILSGTAGKWAILVSDGTNWQIMASN